MSAGWFLVFLLIFPLFGTWFGWKNFLLPIGSFIIPLLWKLLLATIWFGFFYTMTSSLPFYRVFGWDSAEVVIAVTQNDRFLSEYRRDRDAQSDQDGHYLEGSRIDLGNKEKHKATPVNWPMTLTLFGGIAAVFIWSGYRTRKERESKC